MAARQALAIDRDPDFVALLRRALVPYGFEVVAVGDTREGFVRLKMEPPELLFLTVDLPGREGFGLIPRARRLARRVRLVLSTASLPWNEMTLHEITRAHADLYLDKSNLDSDKLIRMLERVIDLGPPAAQASPEPDRQARAETVTGGA